MTARQKVAIVLGARPEAMKLCPVVLAMRARERLASRVCVTAQHREMLDQVLRVFEFVPDADLGARENLLREGVSSGRITVTGNTVIDALDIAVTRTDLARPYGDGMASRRIVEKCEELLASPGGLGQRALVAAPSEH